MNPPTSSCYWCIDNKVLVGGYPDSNTINELKNIGVTHFVNLTEKTFIRTSSNKLVGKYQSPNIIKCPIPNHGTVDYTTIKWLICTIRAIMNNDNALIYIHCESGHGRSGMIASCLLIDVHGFTAEEAMKRITQKYTGRVKYTSTPPSPKRDIQCEAVRNFYNEKMNCKK